jgi:cytochrome c nitrite reductase small subunit
LPYFCQYLFRMPLADTKMSARPVPASQTSNSMIQEKKGRMATRATIQALVTAGFFFFPALAGAQQEATRFQQDPVEQVGARLLVALAVIGIGLVIYSLVKYRGAAVGPVSWGLLIAGAIVFPLLITGVGTILVFERAERVEFCASCHFTMKSFVDDMKNPKSMSLAALHFKNRYIPDDQCYSCHTSYGLFGTVQAKKEGLNDVYKYYTRTYHLPIMLRHPYPNQDCLKCHAGSVKWLAAHEDYKDAIFAGEASCMQCHADSTPAHTVAQNVNP